MVGYELQELTRLAAVYRYYPENDRSNVGIVSFDLASNQGEVLKRADKDDIGWYSMHLFGQLEEFNISGRFKKDGRIAWY